MSIADALAGAIQERQVFYEEKEEALELDLAVVRDREPTFDEYYQYPLALSMICVLLVLGLPQTARKEELS